MDQAEFSALRLAREGFGGGNPETIMDLQVDTVLNMIHFLKFESDYAEAYKRKNQDAK